MEEEEVVVEVNEGREEEAGEEGEVKEEEG